MVVALNVEGIGPFTSQLISAMTEILKSGRFISSFVKKTGDFRSQ